MSHHNPTPEQVVLAEDHTPYFRVFLTLIVVTVIEYGFARLNLSLVAKAAGLVGLSSLYAFLVAWFFMHLKFEGRWVALILLPAGLLTVVVLAGLTPDIAYHRTGFYQSTAVADR